MNMNAKTPISIQRAIWLICTFIAINLIVMALIFVNQDAIGQAVIVMYQGQGIENFQDIVSSYIYGGMAVHVILSVLGLWYTAKIKQGRRWARRSTVIMMVISGLISFYMFTHLLAGNAEIAVHVISDIVKVAVIYLLCFPTDSKEFFRTAKFA